MRRINLFLTFTIVSLVALVAVAMAGYLVLTNASSTYGSTSNWMGQMWGGMGGMMSGNGNTAQTQNAAAPYFGIAFVTLIAIAVVSVSGLIYFFAFPEIRVSQRVNAQPTLKTLSAPPVSEHSPIESTAPYSSVLKTLTQDERKVIEVLTAHDGKYLQKYIRSEVGLSRLQTHRIVARLAERDIVRLEKTGNTNTVMLSNWLKRS